MRGSFEGPGRTGLALSRRPRSGACGPTARETGVALRLGNLRFPRRDPPHVYFHTYSDESCPWRDAELVKRLKPTNHVVEAGLKHRGHSPLTVLKLIRDDPDPPSFLILTRFDILYKSSILETLPPTNDDAGWNKVWLAWRDIPDKWRDYRMVSDLFFLLPTEKLHNFTRAYLKASLIERRHYPAPTGVGARHLRAPPGRAIRGGLPRPRLLRPVDDDAGQLHHHRPRAHVDLRRLSVERDESSPL